MQKLQGLLSSLFPDLKKIPSLSEPRSAGTGRYIEKGIGRAKNMLLYEKPATSSTTERVAT
jgi:hypothetical protein